MQKSLKVQIIYMKWNNVILFLFMWNTNLTAQYSDYLQALTSDLLTVAVVTDLAAHVDRYAHNDDWDGNARYKGDDHRRSKQHAHLPQYLAGLRPWLLPPKCASWGTEAEQKQRQRLVKGSVDVTEKNDPPENDLFVTQIILPNSSQCQSVNIFMALIKKQTSFC